MAEGSELLKEEDFLFHYKNLLLAEGRHETYLCYELEGKKPVVLRNKPKISDKLEGTHAEILFVEDLKALDPKFNDQVTCYLSWSPCADCSNALVEFVKQNTKVKLRILASRLYRYKENKTREGLRSLHAAGVSIDIMAQKDFEYCWDHFVESFPPWEKLKENSDYFIGELQDILQEADIVAGMKKLTTRDDGPTQ